MEDLIKLVISVMEESEKIDGLTGIDKRIYVIEMIELITIQSFGKEYYHEKIEPAVGPLIELFISFSKNEMIIDINKKMKKCFKCIS